MDQTCTGLVINQIRYKDQSFVVKLFCVHYGLKTFIVRVGKTGKSTRHNVLQPLNLLEFESAIRENISMQSVRNLRIARPYHQIPFDPFKSAMVMFLNELLYKTMHDDYVNDKLFEFLRDSLFLLDDALDARNFHLWCLLEISRHYGFYPQPDENGGCKYFDLYTSTFTNKPPGHAFILEDESASLLLDLLDKEWPEVQPLALHSSVRKLLLESLVNYIRIHLENKREIKSLQVLYEVFH